MYIFDSCKFTKTLYSKLNFAIIIKINCKIKNVIRYCLLNLFLKLNNIKEGKVVRIDRHTDITKNMKLIEWMKNELLMSVSELFNILFKGVRSADEGLQDILANIIMMTYLLARRLGISFNEIDYKIKEKTSLGIKEDHSIEKWYGDLTNLKNHIENRE